MLIRAYQEGSLLEIIAEPNRRATLSVLVSSSVREIDRLTSSVPPVLVRSPRCLERYLHRMDQSTPAKGTPEEDDAAQTVNITKEKTY